MATSVRTKSEKIELRVRTELARRWRLKAESEGMSLSQWIRSRCEDELTDVEKKDYRSFKPKPVPEKSSTDPSGIGLFCEHGRVRRYCTTCPSFWET